MGMNKLLQEARLCKNCIRAEWGKRVKPLFYSGRGGIYIEYRQWLFVCNGEFWACTKSGYVHGASKYPESGRRW